MDASIHQSEFAEGELSCPSSMRSAIDQFNGRKLCIRGCLDLPGKNRRHAVDMKALFNRGSPQPREMQRACVVTSELCRFLGISMEQSLEVTRSAPP